MVYLGKHKQRRGPTRPSLVNVGRVVLNIDQHRPTFCQDRPSLAEHSPSLAELGLNRQNVDQHWPTVVESWRSSAPRATFQQLLSMCSPTCGNTACRTRPLPGRRRKWLRNGVFLLGFGRNLVLPAWRAETKFAMAPQGRFAPENPMCLEFLMIFRNLETSDRKFEK